MAQIGTVLEPGQIPGSRVPGISQLPGSGTGNRGKPNNDKQTRHKLLWPRKIQGTLHKKEETQYIYKWFSVNKPFSRNIEASLFKSVVTKKEKRQVSPPLHLALQPQQYGIKKWKDCCSNPDRLIVSHIHWPSQWLAFFSPLHSAISQPTIALELSGDWKSKQDKRYGTISWFLNLTALVIFV